MALTDTMELTMVIRPDGVIEARNDRVIMDGTEELGRKTKRAVFTPDMALADVPAKVRRVANVVWDAATIAAYIAKQQAAQSA